MNTDTSKFESAQNDESRSQSADFLIAYSKPRAFICYGLMFGDNLL